MDKNKQKIAEEVAEILDSEEYSEEEVLHTAMVQQELENEVAKDILDELKAVREGLEKGQKIQKDLNDLKNITETRSRLQNN
jgi:plasmid replication initiation protein